MFYSLIKRNSRANRKENSIYFVSTILAIIAFYVILSLENMDVIRFIRDMESDAVQKLLTLVPALYVFSLFVIFFLVFFTSRYQIERRNHELGMYLMLGMKRSKLFFMLIAEDLMNTFLALVIGLPVAVLFSEIISLTAARLVGIGILGHRFRISFGGILWTVCGLLLVKILTLVLLSGLTVHKEPQDLMQNSSVGREKERSTGTSILILFVGILLLGTAYILALSRRGMSAMSLKILLIILLCGTSGTFLLLKGFYPFFECLMKRQKGKTGLGMFTLRQLQESVFLKNGSLTVISLLALISFCCLAFGISAMLTEKPEHLMDYTFQGEEKEVREILDETGVMNKFQDFYSIRTAYLPTDEEGACTFEYEEFMQALQRQEDSEGKEIMLHNFAEGGYFSFPHILSISDYNELLKAAGKEEILLKDHEILFYANKAFTENGTRALLQNMLSEGIQVSINGQPYTMKKEMAEYHIVTDQVITLAFGLVLPDALFEEIIAIKNTESTYWNAVLKEEVFEKNGLIQVISDINETLNQTAFKSAEGLHYESYIQNIGRHLFYIIAESYTTLYLGIIFLVIANTALGTQYLMYQQKTGKRYQTVSALGGSYQAMRKSGRTQIRWYFLLPVLVAAVSSVFGLVSFTEGLLSSYFAMQKTRIFLVGILVVLMICVVESLYMMAVMRVSDRSIRGFIKQVRGDE